MDTAVLDYRHLHVYNELQYSQANIPKKKFHVSVMKRFFGKSEVAPTLARREASHDQKVGKLPKDTPSLRCINFVRFRTAVPICCNTHSLDHDELNRVG